MAATLDKNIAIYFCMGNKEDNLTSYLPKLHNQVHKGGGGAVGLLGCAHG